MRQNPEERKQYKIRQRCRRMLARRRISTSALVRLVAQKKLPADALSVRKNAA